MAKVTHPSMRRARDSSVQRPEPQSYTVEDETGAHSESYADPEATMQEVPAFVPPVPEEIKREPMLVDSPQPAAEAKTERKSMLEDLIFLGRASKDVDIGGHNFVITTLTHREHNDLMKQLYKFGDGADLFTLRTLTLAFALKSVNGTPLEEMHMPLEEEEKFSSDFDKKLGIIDTMQMNVVTKLYDAYNELADSVDKNLQGEEVKN